MKSKTSKEAKVAKDRSREDRGPAQRRSETREESKAAEKSKGKKRGDDSPRIFEWLPVTQKQRDQFFDISIKAGWVGIGGLVVIWVVVRFIGPALGWWIPADVRY